MPVDKGKNLKPEQKQESQAEGQESRLDEGRLDSSFSKLQGLVDKALDGDAIGGEADLRKATGQLTLAQWGLRRHDTFRRQWLRQTAMTVASAITLAYLFYRAFWTMNLEGPWAIGFSAALLAAEMYAGFMLLLYFFQVWRLVNPPLRSPTPGRSVDVFVTTYNEEIDLLRGTLQACVDMDYPHTTYVLDDGARPEVERLAKSLGVNYLSRQDRKNAKAGNLNNALQHSNGDYVVVLDADHVPYRHYITRLIGYFDDPRLGFVQTPHTTYNLDNFLGRWKQSARVYWEDVRIFFEAVQLGKNRHGVACFCGSAAIFRRKALEEAGLFATETITEDMHTGIRVNAAGWKSIAVSEEMVVGLAPDDAATFSSQRLRWGEGNLSIFAYDNPLTMKGLTPAGRLQHFASLLCWTMGPSRLIIYLTPLVMLLGGVPPVADMQVAYFVIVTMYLASVLTAVKLASNRCGQLLGIELAMMASFHLHLRALWRAIFRRKRQKFVVTKKGGAAGTSVMRRMWPQAALVVAGIVAVSWATSRIAFGISDDYLGLFIGSGLAAYHGWLALTIFDRASRKSSFSQQWRHPACLAADYSYNGEEKSAVSLEFNENACRLLTWDRLDTDAELQITLHSPAGNATAHGRVERWTPLGGRNPFAYLNHIVFNLPDNSQGQTESDSLRALAMRYVVPVVIMAHRFVRRGRWPSLEALSGEGTLPMPLDIDAGLPNIAIQKTVPSSLDRRGFLATLKNAYPVGHSVKVTICSPVGKFSASATVTDVETIRVGTSLVHQHRFVWRDYRPLRHMLSRRKHWATMLERINSDLRSSPTSIFRIAAIQLAACVLVILTVLVYEKINHEDIMFATVAAQRQADSAQLERVKVFLKRQKDISREPVDRLLRIYEAAVTAGDQQKAAQAAKLLADRVADRRGQWMLTHARHLVGSGDKQAADAAFDAIIADRLDREFSPEDRAQVYVEAARAAVAVNNMDKAVEHFFTASNFTSADPVLAEELLGVLIAGGKTEPSLKILAQMEQTDDVLRRIISVHDIAGKPQGSLEAVLELHRRHPDDVNVIIRLADLALMRRDFKVAIGYYEKLLRERPESEKVKEKYAEAKILVARDHVKAARLQEALDLFEESFRLHSPDDKVKREYAGILAQAGRLDEAAAILTQLNDADSQRALAAILEMKGDKAAALAILLRLEKQQYLDLETQRAVTRLMLAEKQYDDAAVRLADLIKEYPQDQELRRAFIDAVAAAQLETPQLRQATADVFLQYMQNGYTGLDDKGMQTLGYALRRMKLYDQAHTELKTAVERFPNSRRLRLSLAQTLGSLGRYVDAEKQYEILLASRPK